MKYFVTTTDGYITASNASEALQILSETDNAIEAVEVDSEECIYDEDRNVLAKK